MMEKDEIEAESVAVNVSEEESQALNATILDYYRKFGKKRDLEQYFSLSTAQGELRDPSSLFWRRMKAQHDSSDSGEKSRDSSLEVCRISIKCSLPDTEATSSQSQDDNPKTKETESPPIITEELPADTSRPSDDESVKSDNNSHKSMDVILDTSINKAFSPTSSITSQRKLEWDSLADVGYANESDKANTASSLSTLERLALQQQYSNNDTKQDSLGVPTAHSTPVDENDSKNKGKKAKTTRIYRKDVDLVEFNMPNAENNSSINVNLTKHISFNVEKDGGVSVGNVKRDLMVIPERDPPEQEYTSQTKSDKEIQTSLIKNKVGFESHLQLFGNSVPVLINLNTLKKRNRKRKLKTARRRLRMKKKIEANKENVPVLEKSGEQVSEAESFEYMPGHIYNQNQLNQEPLRASIVDNKSSLESSAAVTTDSSKDSKHSFTRDLEKSIKLLKATLSRHYNDSDLKQKLIKDVVQRLLQNRYRDDETTTEFLSGLSFSSKKLGMRGDTTTSTSDANNTAEKSKPARPKKSILRNDKLNTNAVASTSQSAPNLPSVSKSDKPVSSKLTGNITSHTESDASSREKQSSDTAFEKTSSEELYLKYLDALKREEAYKKHLREKELFLKQRLVSSDVFLKVPAKLDSKSQNKLKELMKDLTRNNYDDGSGDASKLEGGPSTTDNVRYPVPSIQRSHSVFTLSSEASEQKKPAKKEEHRDSEKPGHSRAEQYYCCCPLHFENRVTDSSVQVNIREDGNVCGNCDDKLGCKLINVKGCECNQKSGQAAGNTCYVSNNTGDFKYVCVCNSRKIQEANNNLLIYKCARVNNHRSAQSNSHNAAGTSKKAPLEEVLTAKACKCSQTNLKLKLPDEDYQETVCIHEAVRCIQTDISIDPKISDPSLTDIKIIKHCDCVRLIREQFREVCKSVSDEQAGDCRGQRSQEKSKELIQTPKQSKHTGVQFDANMLKSGDGDDGNFIDIPIQGTNMTLKVSVGSHGANPSQKTHYVHVDEAKERKKSPCSSRPHSPKVGRHNSPVKIPVHTTETSTQLGVRKKQECGDSTEANRKERPEEKIIKTSDYRPEVLSTTLHYPTPNTSQNEDNMSDIDRRRELFDTIFKRNENATVPNKAATSKLNKKPFLRTNTDPQILEKSVDAQRDLLDKIFARQQGSTDTMTDGSKKQEPKKAGCKSNTYPKGEEQKPADRFSSSLRTERRNSPEKTGRYSPRKTSRPDGGNNPTEKYETNKQSSPRKSPQRIEKVEKYKPKSPRRRSNVPSLEKEKCGKELEPQDSVVMIDPDGTLRTRCGCPDTAPCEGFCTEDAACRSAQKSDTEVTPQPSPDPSTLEEDQTSEISSDSKPPLRLTKIESPRKKSTEVRKIEMPQKYPKPLDSSMNEKKVESPPLTEKPTTSKRSDHAPAKELHKEGTNKDMIMSLIQDITNRYTKKDVEKDQRKKCFKEIVSLLSYLLDTEDATDSETAKLIKGVLTDSTSSDSSSKKSKIPDTGCGKCRKTVESSSSGPICKESDDKTVDSCCFKKMKSVASLTEDTCKGHNECSCHKKRYVDRSVQQCTRKAKSKCYTESSDLPCSTDIPCTSSDSATCKVLNKIRKECEKYHQRRCKTGKKCECSSTTSISCNECKRVHHCLCRASKCKGYKTRTCEKFRRKCIAYNLIIQTSDSIVSEEPASDKTCRPLKNIIVKVPPKLTCSPRSEGRGHRSRSLPNEGQITNIDNRGETTVYTVRDYLERNRPEFVEQCTQRQNCLKMISESRANERAIKRELLSMQVQLGEPMLRALSEADLRDLARDLGVKMRKKKDPAKFISEREMKKHSEKIYKTLPEVVRKKEDLKKERIKKTNLLMASLFKKNLQKKTLRGDVNLSNYSPVIKI